MAKLLYLPDFGLLPDTNTDCTEILQSIIDNLPRDGENITLCFKKGTYRIGSAVVICGVRDLTLQGSGSTVIAHFDPVGPISHNNDVFHLCGNLSLDSCRYGLSVNKLHNVSFLG